MSSLTWLNCQAGKAGFYSRVVKPIHLRTLCHWKRPFVNSSMEISPIKSPWRALGEVTKAKLWTEEQKTLYQGFSFKPLIQSSTVHGIKKVLLEGRNSLIVYIPTVFTTFYYGHLTDTTSRVTFTTYSYSVHLLSWMCYRSISGYGLCSSV